MTDDEENLLKKRLRLKWLPCDEGFDATRADVYDRFLSLPVDEQTEIVRGMNAEDGELYIVLSNARMHYSDSGI